MSKGTDKFDLIKNGDHWSLKLWKDIVRINMDLFKVMIPIVILVKIAQEMGIIDSLALLLAPVMSLVDLPASMGLVWATTMISNIYSGMIVFVALSGNEVLSVAQVTTLGGMMLIAHSLPIEVSIARKTGMRALFSLSLRVAVALLYGYLLSVIYRAGGWLTEANTVSWIPASVDVGLLQWTFNQLVIFFKIFMIIAVLVSFLRFLTYSGIEKGLIFFMQPLLKMTGLGPKTMPISIVGMGLGLTYGGGLLIQEARSGELDQKEIFGAMFLLALCHGLIEDTLLVMLLGADITGALYIRVVFSLLLTAIVIRLVRVVEAPLFNRFIMLKTKYPNNAAQ